MSRSRIAVAIVVADNKESSILSISKSIKAKNSHDYNCDIFSVKHTMVIQEGVSPLLSNILSLSRYDLIHVHAAIPLSLVILFKILYPKKNIIVTLHDNGWEYFKNNLSYPKASLLRILSIIGLTLSDKIIFPSKSLADKYAIRNRSISKKSIVIHNGISDPYKNHPRIVSLGSRRVAKRVIIVGNYYYSKGVDLVVAVSSILPEYEFHYFGNVLNGIEDKGKIKDITKKENCHFHGLVPRKIFLDYLIDRGGIVLLPSRSEVCPLLLMEAMASGSPIVVSNIDVFYELVNENDAKMFDLNDLSTLIESIKTVYSEQQFYSVNARKKYISNYKENIMTEKYASVYDYYTRQG